MIENRATIIFGNGIGMALDSEFYELKSALNHVWSNSENLLEEHKKLIRSALPEIQKNAYPESEDMLDKLQIAIVAAEVLKEYENSDVEWLNQASREIPSTFKRYIHEVAMYFHSSRHALPLEFVSELSRFIENTSSHIAVLNYDNLLYDGLCQTKILNGFSGYLIDGFTKTTGFNSENLKRKRENLAWFIHLHGSPLFVNDRKETGINRDFLLPSSECHIVLTHVKHKPFIISRSKILAEYWLRLARAIKESSAIILFGYSGRDVHLNKIISAQGGGKRICVVEWEGSGGQDERNDFWNKTLDAQDVKLIQLNNILNFKAWDDIKKIKCAAVLPF